MAVDIKGPDRAATDRGDESSTDPRVELEAILRGITDGITVIDPSGRFIYANEAAAGMLGYPSPHSLLAHDGPAVMQRYCVFDDRGAAMPPERTPTRLALLGEEPPETLIRFRLVDSNEEKWAWVRAIPVRDERGGIRFAVSFFRDVTRERERERRRAFFVEASRAIGSSIDYEETLATVARLVVPTIADWCAVDIVQTDGKLHRLAVAHSDPARAEWASELSRCFPPEPTVPRGGERLLHTGRPELVPEVSDERLAAAIADPALLASVRKLGLWSWMAVPLIAQGRSLGVITFVTAESRRRFSQEDLRLAEDVCQRAALAVEHARLYREAQEANRVKDDFLATLSHELRTPLNAVLGWSRMLRAGMLDLPTQARALATIERNAHLQVEMIEDLLDVARIITGKLALDVQLLAPAALILAAVETVRPAADAKGIQIELGLDEQVGAIAGDTHRLQQVMWNLLSNAIKFTPRGGVVRLSLRASNGEVEIRVSDTGKGIAPEFLPFVFHRFRQADASSTRAHGGLGLGLAIARHLVELHAGRIAVESAGEGRGATFTVRLALAAQGASADPVASTIPAGASPAPIAALLPRLDGVSVLLVDDESETLDLLSTVLEHCGARVTAVRTATEALLRVPDLLPDVVLSDIGMPDEDGYAFIRKLRALPPERGGRIPAAAITAYARPEDRTRALRAGFQTHIPKPVEPAELAAAVATLAGRCDGR